PQRLPGRRTDTATANLAAAKVERLEGDLTAMNVQGAYDLHRDLLELHGLEHDLRALPRLCRGGPTTCHLCGQLGAARARLDERAQGRQPGQDQGVPVAADDRPRGAAAAAGTGADHGAR